MYMYIIYTNMYLIYIHTHMYTYIYIYMYMHIYTYWCIGVLARCIVRHQHHLVV